MSVDKIIEKIRNDADAQVSAILGSGEKEREKIQAEGGKEADKLKDQHIIAGKREVDAITARMRAQARMEARQTVRETRENIVQKCFDLANEQLMMIPGDARYSVILTHLIAESIREIGSDNVILFANRRDFAIIKKILREGYARGVSITLSDHPIEVSGGVVLRTLSGDRSVNNSFEARLERMHRDMVIAVAEILSNDEAGKIP
ncbi:MAG TPA: V-type ATP synthase subunit E family protein [Methanoregulaceae archaeon]|nr:V-type ATP synthase subunit E family protein [Methanoregulaceae archaeon]